jgi:hypothetical protein
MGFLDEIPLLCENQASLCHLLAEYGIHCCSADLHNESWSHENGVEQVISYLYSFTSYGVCAQSHRIDVMAFVFFCACVCVCS